MKKQTKEQVSSREQQMRRRIKDAAFKLMADKGIDGVSMREIAEKVHVTKPVLYYYFKDREDLCSAIIEEHKKRLENFLQEVAVKGASAEELLSSTFERHISFFLEDPRNSKFVAATMAYALSNKAKSFSRKSSDLLRTLLEDAAKKENIPQSGLMDLEYLARAVLLQFMLSAYVQLHMPELKEIKKEYLYDKDTVHRLARIMILGVKAYYKRK